MKPSTLPTYISFVFAALLAIICSAAASGGDTEYRCGAQGDGVACPNNLCCSEYGWCGSSSAYCGGGCQSGPCDGGTDEPGYNRNYCGSSWEMANEQCSKSCPLGMDAECDGYDKCYADTDNCDAVLIPDYPNENRNYCGSSWEDANYKCTRPCPHGKDSECIGGETCYADAISCPLCPVPPIPNPPTPNPTCPQCPEVPLIPTRDPTISPTLSPTLSPSLSPTLSPTQAPSLFESGKEQTLAPTEYPTKKPSPKPTPRPTKKPVYLPEILDPTIGPTLSPSLTPTLSPSLSPTLSPSLSPTLDPTQIGALPTSDRPTRRPTRRPTKKPVWKSAGNTRRPTRRPTKKPHSEWNHKPHPSWSSSSSHSWSTKSSKGSNSGSKSGKSSKGSKGSRDDDEWWGGGGLNKATNLAQYALDNNAGSSTSFKSVSSIVCTMVVVCIQAYTTLC